MSTTTSEVLEPRQFIGGRVGRRRRTVARSRTSTRSPARSSPASPPAPPRTRARRSTPPPRRSPPGRRRPPAERQAHLPQAADMLESRRTRSSGCWPARPAAASASACSRCTSCRACSGRPPALAYAPTGEIIPSDIPGAFAMGMRRPVGVVGAIAPVERRADPLGALDRRAAGARQHGRAQALGGVADRRRPDLGRDLRRGRAARRACSTSSPTRAGRGRADRRRAGREPGACGASTSPARPAPAASSPRPPGATSSASCSSWAARTR